MATLFQNRYRVLAELGQGAMGQVYKVADTVQGDAILALKTIRVDGAITPALRLRFKEEFRIMAQLRHPNTLAVYDFGTLDDHNHYFTMELVPGVELAELVAAGPMPLERFYPLLIQLLQALSFIHSRHYVHRDIKSQNIRVRDDGTLKLMDFGLTCQAGQSSRGQLNGTPGTMAPEMIVGGVLDAATDLYAVGCLAYEMLTGRLPFVGRVVEVLRAHRDERPVPPRNWRPDLPERLEAVVLQLLEKEPARRYRSSEDVIADLAALAGLTLARENMEQRKSYLNSRALVGRERELQVLSDALAGLKEGRGGALLIGAPAGVGKSRLMQEFGVLASLGEVQVLLGACQEAGHGPYEAVAQALKGAIPLTSQDEWSRFGPVLAGLLPQVIEQGLVSAPAPELADAMQDKLRLHDTLLAWLEAVAERHPLVLLLDDLHQADPQSVALFNHCVRHRTSGRLLLAGTFRNDETPPSSPIWFTQAEGHSRFITLEPLKPEQVGELLQAMLNAVDVPPAFSRALVDLTGGNPFFVREVLLFMLEEGLLTSTDGVWRFPLDGAGLSRIASVESTVERRLAHMSAAARELAQVAAVIGRNMDIETLLVVSGMDEDEFLTRMDELLERQFLTRDDAAIAFAHDRLRETLYATTPEADRRAWHLRAAAHIETRARAGSTSRVFELAHHYHAGANMGLAFEYLCLAGDVASQRGADALALDCWRQALEALGGHVPPERELALLLAIGRNGFILAPQEAIQAFERALVLLGPHDPTRLEVLTLLGNAYGFLGAPHRGLAVVEQALAVCPPEARELRAAILTVKATNMMAAGRFDEMGAIAREAGAVLMRQDLEGPPLVLGARVGVAAFQNGVCFQGVRPDERLCDFAYWASAQIGDEHPITIRQFFAIWYAWTGRHEEAAEAVEELAALSRRIGAPPYHWVLYLRPYMLMQRGEYPEALAQIDVAFQYPQLEQVELTRSMIAVLQGQALSALGRHKAAQMVLSTVLESARATGMALVAMQALIALGQVALAKGDPARAAQALSEAHAMASDGAARNPLHQAIAARCLAAVALEQGRHGEALAHLDEALAIVRRPEQDNRIEQAHCHRLLGEAEHARGRREEALQALKMAGSLYRKLKNAEALHGVIQRLEVISKQPLPPATREMPLEARWQFMTGLLN